MNDFYYEAKEVCWRCKKETRVYSWRWHDDWEKEEPQKEGRPINVMLAYSKTAGVVYWANVCEYCNALQGDWFLYGPSGPFWIGDPNYIEWRDNWKRGKDFWVHLAVLKKKYSDKLLSAYHLTRDDLRGNVPYENDEDMWREVYSPTEFDEKISDEASYIVIEKVKKLLGI